MTDCGISHKNGSRFGQRVLNPLGVATPQPNEPGFPFPRE